MIADHYLQTKTDSALILGEKMLNYAQKKKNVKYEIEAFTLISEIYFEKEENYKATENYTKGLELAKTNKDSTLYASKLLQLGYLYYEYDDYTNAFKTLQKSQKLCKKLGDRLNEGWSVAYQGFIFSALGDYKEAEKYHLEHLRLSKKYGIKRRISGANGNLGSVYNKMGNIPKSIKHWKEGIRLSKEIGLEEYASVGTGNLLKIYINQKQFSEAIKYLNEYKTVTEQFTTPKYTRNFSMNIHLWQCQIEYGLGNYNKALKECEDCLKISKTNNWNPSSELLKSLYQINKKLNRYKKALNFYEEYQLLIDDEKEDKARTEIQNIIFNNQITADSIAQEKEKELLNVAYEEGLRKKNKEKNLFLIIGLLVLLIAAAYFQFSRRIAARESKRLKEVDQLKNALFTNITHEFRTPLTVIKGMTSAIKFNLEKNKRDDIKNSLELIDRNSDGLLQLVNEMLDLAKIESGIMELNLIQTNIIPFIKYLTHSFHSLAEEKEITFSVQSKIDELEMDFDADKLTSIVSNLLSNAIKFTPKKGKVKVQIDKITKSNTDFLLLKIKDNGLGISKKEQSHIFDKFYQVKNTSTKLGEGTGIGLALVKELVELMEGSIDVKSSSKKGSLFRVHIPITNNAEKMDDPELTSQHFVSKNKILPTPSMINSSIEEKTNNSPLVLIIEDNIDVAYYIKTCLQDRYRILYAPNGVIGIEMAYKKVPDIVISDVMMPEKNGFEVCASLKTDELTNHIPIIMLTAKATFEDRLTGLSHGADAYLTKPFEKSELLTRIEQLILFRKKMLLKFEKTGIEQLLNKNIQKKESEFLQKTIIIIHENLIQTGFGPVQLALQLRLSESQLYRKLKATSGKSTAVFIRSIRLQKGKELIQTTDKTISEIAYDIGFNDPSYFSRAFKEEFGHAPSSLS